MAIIKSLAVGKAKGSAGNLTYTYQGGDTIMKGKVAFPKIPRTFRQMNQRVAWANLVNFWRGLEGYMHPSFELAAGRVSDFNLYMSRNINSERVFLTRSNAAAGETIVAPYKVTEGSLTSIIMEAGENGVIHSSIGVGSLQIDDETTLAAFSAAVRANNTGWEYGDQLSAFVFIQTTDVVSGVNRMTCKAFEITLAEDDNTLLLDLVNNDPTCFAVTTGGKLGLTSAINGGAVYVHSRIENGETLVSSQSVFVTNNVLNSFTTAAARTAAIQSYGGKLSNEFLTPEIDTNNPD